MAALFLAGDMGWRGVGREADGVGGLERFPRDSALRLF